MTGMTRRDILSGSILLAGGAMLTAGAGEQKDNAGKTLKMVVAGAHPDDPESAAGGTIALYTDAGHEVVSLYLTRGEAGIRGKSHEEAAAIRTAEAEDACKLLGARPVYAGQIDGATEINAHWYDVMLELLRKEAPDIVITHWPIDTHRDHRIISLLVYDAWLHMDQSFELFYFEVESGRQTQQFHPTHYVDITTVETRKRDACYAMKSQNAVKGFYVDHAEMHKFRGRQVGVKYAEAFVRHNGNVLNGLPG